MADTEAVVADSAPVAETAPSEAVEQADATHGDQTEQATTPSDTDTQPGDSTPDDLDDGDEESTENQTDEEKSRSQQRRERRQAREADRIAKAVEAEISRRESERQTQAQQAKAEAEARAAAEAWQQEFGQIVGTPDARKALSDEIERLIQTTISVDPEMADYAELQRLTEAQKALAAKRQQLQTLDANLKTYQKLDEFQFRQTQHEFAGAGSDLPDTYRQRYLQARTVPEALAILRDGLVAREAAKAKAEVERVTAEWRSRYEKEVAAHAATRTGAAGAGPSPEAGGRSHGNGPDLTPERYASMDSTERAKLRATAEGRARIDAMMRRARGAA